VVQTVAVEDSRGKKRYVPLKQWISSDCSSLYLCNQYGKFCLGMPTIDRSEIRGAWCHKENHANRFKRS